MGSEMSSNLKEEKNKMEM